MVLISRSEEHTSELQSRLHLVCRLLLEKKKHFYRTTGRLCEAATQGDTPLRPLPPEITAPRLEVHDPVIDGNSQPGFFFTGQGKPRFIPPPPPPPAFIV